MHIHVIPPSVHACMGVLRVARKWRNTQHCCLKVGLLRGNMLAVTSEKPPPFNHDQIAHGVCLVIRCHTTVTVGWSTSRYIRTATVPLQYENKTWHRDSRNKAFQLTVFRLIHSFTDIVLFLSFKLLLYQCTYNSSSTRSNNSASFKNELFNRVAHLACAAVLHWRKMLRAICVRLPQCQRHVWSCKSNTEPVKIYRLVVF